MVEREIKLEVRDDVRMPDLSSAATGSSPVRKA
jgi:hypothetical protein